MRLYYYTKLQYGLAAIRDQRIKISLYESLNDPFDFLGIATTNRNQRRELKRMRDDLSPKAGIICLSETWKQPLMWGHYADAHRGVCLGFNVRAGHYQDIRYHKERPTLKSFGKASVSELTEQDKIEIAHRKFEQWSYEREWRRVVDLNDPDFVDGNYYLPFGNDMELKYVLFGSRSGIKEQQIKQVLDLDSEIKIAITRPANTAFDIVIDNVRTKRLVPEDSRILQLPVLEHMTIRHQIEKITETAGKVVLKKMLAHTQLLANAANLVTKRKITE